MQPPRKTYGGRKARPQVTDPIEPTSPPSDAGGDAKISIEEMNRRMKKRTRYLVAISPAPHAEQNVLSASISQEQRQTNKRKADKDEPDLSGWPDADALANTPHPNRPSSEHLSHIRFTEYPPISDARLMQNCSRKIPRRPSSAKLKENPPTPSRRSQNNPRRAPRTPSQPSKRTSQRTLTPTAAYTPSATRMLRTPFLELKGTYGHHPPLQSKTPNYNIRDEDFSIMRMPVRRTRKKTKTSPANTNPTVVHQYIRTSSEHNKGDILVARRLSSTLGTANQLSLSAQPFPANQSILFLPSGRTSNKDSPPFHLNAHTLSPFLPLEASTPKRRRLGSDYEEDASMEIDSVIGYSPLYGLGSRRMNSFSNPSWALGPPSNPAQHDDEDVKMDTDATPRTSIFSGSVRSPLRLDLGKGVRSSVADLSPTSRTPTPTSFSRHRTTFGKDSIFSSQTWSVPSAYASLSRERLGSPHHTELEQGAPHASHVKRTKNRRKESVAKAPLSDMTLSAVPSRSAARASYSCSLRSTRRRSTGLTDMSLASVTHISQQYREKDPDSDMSLASVASTFATDVSPGLGRASPIPSFSSEVYPRQPGHGAASPAIAQEMADAFADAIPDGICFSSPDNGDLHTYSVDPDVDYVGEPDSLFDPSSAFTRGKVPNDARVETAELHETEAEGTRGLPIAHLKLSGRSSISARARGEAPLHGVPPKRVSFVADFRMGAEPSAGTSGERLAVGNRPSSWPGSPPDFGSDGSQGSATPTAFSPGVLTSPPPRTASPGSSSPDPLDIISPEPSVRRQAAVRPPSRRPPGWIRMLNRMGSPPGSSPDPLLLRPRPHVVFLPEDELDDDGWAIVNMANGRRVISRLLVLGTLLTTS